MVLKCERKRIEGKWRAFESREDNGNRVILSQKTREGSWRKCGKMINVANESSKRARQKEREREKDSRMDVEKMSDRAFERRGREVLEEVERASPGLRSND